MNEKINLEVVYAKPEQQTLLTVQMMAGSTIEAAIIQSGVLKLFPEINLASQKIGIFGKICALSDCPQDKDRIEIYRPLIINPKEARRSRARANKIR